MGYTYRGTQQDLEAAPDRKRTPGPNPAPFDPAKCGERRGYKQHYRHGQEPCDACRAANSAYLAARRAAELAAHPREPRTFGVYDPATCGTNTGYHRHVRAKTPACAQCLAAHATHQAAYEAERRAA